MCGIWISVLGNKLVVIRAIYRRYMRCRECSGSDWLGILLTQWWGSSISFSPRRFCSFKSSYIHVLIYSPDSNIRRKSDGVMTGRGLRPSELAYDGVRRCDSAMYLGLGIDCECWSRALGIQLYILCTGWKLIGGWDHCMGIDMRQGAFYLVLDGVVGLHRNIVDRV